MQENVATGVGRGVWGNPCKPQPKKHQDGAMKGQPVLKDGVPVQQWAMGIAIPKAQFAAAVWPFMESEAKSGYPNGVPPRFSWKYVDGDGVDSKGISYALREGYAGCYVLTISTEAFAPQVVKLNAAGTGYDQLTAEQIKPGDYFHCVVNLKVNVATGTNTPSLYVNPVIIEHVGYGTEIRSAGAVDPMTVLGGARHALPAGASAVPMQPVSGITPPGMPGAPPAPGGMPGMPPVTPAALAPPPPPPAGPQRPTEPTHIHAAGTPQEQWFINGAWTPAVVAPLPPPAVGFASPPGMPGAPPAPGGMPGMPGPR